MFNQNSTEQGCKMDLDQLNILVVDDDKLLRQLIDIFLSAHGAKVTCCEDGITAYHKATIGKFNCIISDINMPYMTGLELLSRIRNILRDETPLILMSGQEMLNEQDVIQNGGQAFLKKPFNLPSLKTLIQTYSN
jgi:CheY-like chemotaxis protein